MNAITYYSEAIKKVDSGEITIGEYERMIKVLRDVEPVVRCKDCKWWRDTDHTCKEHSLVSPMRAEEFCSRGKRKDGDNGKTD